MASEEATSQEAGGYRLPLGARFDAPARDVVARAEGDPRMRELLEQMDP